MYLQIGTIRDVVVQQKNSFHLKKKKLTFSNITLLISFKFRILKLEINKEVSEIYRKSLRQVIDVFKTF